MSTERANSPSSTSPPNHQRRASLNPSAFTELFSRSNGSGSPTMSNSTGSPPFSSSMSAAVNAQSNQRRRLSITTLGLSGSPNQTSPFVARPMRTESLSSTGSYEEAVDDSENVNPNNQPSPFVRRVSFGAQALRDVRGGSGTGNGRYSFSRSSPTKKSPTTRTSSAKNPPSAPSTAASTSKLNPKSERSNPSWRPLGEGFNWSEALRSRAERTPSMGGGFSTSPQNPQSSLSDPQAHRQRAASIAIMEQPARELPKEPRQNKPDFFQEKILRADFMD